MKHIWVVFLIGVSIVGLVGVVNYFNHAWSSSSQAVETIKTPTEVAASKAMDAEAAKRGAIELYFNRLITGQPLESLDCTSPSITHHFYAVRKAEILSTKESAYGGLPVYMVRVESSDANGRPIIDLVEVVVFSNVNDAYQERPENYCISSVVKRVPS